MQDQENPNEQPVQAVEATRQHDEVPGSDRAVEGSGGGVEGDPREFVETSCGVEPVPTPDLGGELQDTNLPSGEGVSEVPQQRRNHHNGSVVPFTYILVPGGGCWVYLPDGWTNGSTVRLADETTVGRVCSHCKRTYPATIEFFYKHRSHSGGLSAWCRACYRNRYKEHTPVKHRTIVDMTQPKRCPSCMESKPRTLEFWYKNERLADGLSGWCRTCYRKGRQKQAYKTFIELMKTTGGYHSDFTFDVFCRMRGYK
jgi:hypothetical protein